MGNYGRLWAIDRSLHGGQKTEDNDDFRYIRYIGFDTPNSKSQIETRSGRYNSKMLYRNKTGKISGQILTPASPVDKESDCDKRHASVRTIRGAFLSELLATVSGKYQTSNCVISE
ncbi:hypothetical protein [Trichormus azollae]|uniref:hypothetical protein n=1 Tax=Trichormus azollae TaxID=1164 RepID=UPI00325EDCE4